MLQNNLKERMKAGETVYGPFINSGSTIACEVAGLCGFDFLMIDSEHGPTDVLLNRDLITAAEYRGCPPLVRVSNASYDLILRTLDVGAHGIMVPQVNTKEKAEAIAYAAHYYPEGLRGVASTRSSDYGFCSPFPRYFELANKRNLTIAQCENLAGVPYLDDICSVEGIDMIFVGPYDLSSSMGQPGQVGYDAIKEVVEKVLEATKKHGKLAGIFTKDAAEAKMYSEMGFRFIIVGTDIGCMVSGMKNIANTLKG